MKDPNVEGDIHRKVVVALPSKFLAILTSAVSEISHTHATLSFCRHLWQGHIQFDRLPHVFQKFWFQVVASYEFEC